MANFAVPRRLENTIETGQYCITQEFQVLALKYSQIIAFFILKVSEGAIVLS